MKAFKLYSIFLVIILFGCNEAPESLEKGADDGAKTETSPAETIHVICPEELEVLKALYQDELSNGFVIHHAVSSSILSETTTNQS